MICNKVCPAVQLWHQTDAVCFDFDSTLVKDEFIDQMADYVGKGPEVSAVTKLAMAGSFAFEDALEARLKTINITESLLKQLIDSKPTRITEGAHELISALQRRNVDVFVISGSFEKAVHPIAEVLGIPKERVFANRLFFSSDGAYAGFDRERPTARKGGKRTIVEMLKEKHCYKCLTFIGDGATDLETYDPPRAADLFIGFGGNVVREPVRKKAPLFVESFSQLTEWLEPMINGCNCGTQTASAKVIPRD